VDSQGMISELHPFDWGSLKIQAQARTGERENTMNDNHGFSFCFVVF